MTDEEVELLLQIVADSTLGATFQERFNGIMEAFTALVPTSSMTAFVLDVPRETAPTADHTIFRNGEVAQLQEYAANYIPVDPMLPGLAAMDGIPTTLSDFVSSSKWSRDAYTGEFLPRFGVRHIMGVSNRMPDGSLLSLGFQRDRGVRDFTARERKLVRLVSPYLSRAAYGAILKEKIASRSSPPEGMRRERVGVALFDANGSMVHADASALGLLAALTESGVFSVDALVAEARRLCGAGVSEGAALERMVVLRERGLVRVTLARTGSGEGARVVVTLELTERGSRAHFDETTARLGLTPREREVAAHAIRGLGNREIGVRLRISPITVGVLLTKIYNKVGVHGRGELTALLLGGPISDEAPPRAAAP